MSDQIAQPIDPVALERQWRAPYVARTQPILDLATGGLVNAKTLANLDSLGQGPKGRLRMGKKIAYPSRDFFTWLAARLKPAAEECGKAVGAK